MAAYAGKVVVVTGASQGIGKALCLELAPQGPRLVLAARDAGALERVAAECRPAGAETLVVPTDVADESACRALVAKVVERFGALDVLVNNAGIGMLARFEDVTDLSLYERLMRVNYLGSVYPTAYALPHLKRSGGQIVAVSSLAGLSGVPMRTAYAATKHAQMGFFDSLRVELRGTGVSVTVIAPYFVQSEIRRRSPGPDGRKVEAFSSLLWEGVHTYRYVGRATTPGTFVVPPPKAEEMYAPETFGRGATDRVIIE